MGVQKKISLPNQLFFCVDWEKCASPVCSFVFHISFALCFLDRVSYPRFNLSCVYPLVTYSMFRLRLAGQLNDGLVYVRPPSDQSIDVPCFVLFAVPRTAFEQSSGRGRGGLFPHEGPQPTNPASGRVQHGTSRRGGSRNATKSVCSLRDCGAAGVPQSRVVQSLRLFRKGDGR